MAKITNPNPPGAKPGPLLYAGPPRWQVWAAIGGALALHGIAAVIAGLKPEPPPAVDMTQLEQIAEVTFETAEPEPTPPPEEMIEPEPVDAPPEPTEVPEFVEDTGSGVCVMDVDTSSGAVTSASMAVSTGNPILDNAATSAFRRWRFKPGTVSKVRTPITFTMTGAQY
ncbi:MAG: energy transducer TonB [Verrucomicrobiaceae bacterium]|nr:energy transducer TonB [Verrucomicrobiaceae bacterium]